MTPEMNVPSPTAWCDFRHLQSAPNKAFQHVKVDTLCQPEAMSSVAVPGEYKNESCSDNNLCDQDF